MDENPKIVSLGPGARGIRSQGYQRGPAAGAVWRRLVEEADQPYHRGKPHDFQMPCELSPNRGEPFGRVVDVFDETFADVEEQFPDIGTVELYEDDKAGADNGAGADRQFAYCMDGDPLVIAFAPKAEALSERQLRGLMRHEFGHALEYRYGVAKLEEALGQKLPSEVERRADTIAEAVWGVPIRYDSRNIQCIGHGKHPRPAHLPDEKTRLRANRGQRWYFEGVDGLIEAVRETSPSYEHVSTEPEAAYEGRRVGWAPGHYVVEVPVEKVLFMEGNLWNLPHAAALLERIEREHAPVFRLPAARLYRIDGRDVEDTRRWDEEGELSYQMSMERPWSEADAGTFYVQLLDGNHRALAAMAAGEATIFVTVGPNYRDDVREGEWVEPLEPNAKRLRANPGFGSNARAVGQCYPFAFELATEYHGDPDTRIAHGRVNDRFSGESYLHAWVERGDRVFDWQTRVTKPEGVELPVFYDIYQPTDVTYYTPEEVVKACVREGHHGPWEE